MVVKASGQRGWTLADIRTEERVHSNRENKCRAGSVAGGDVQGRAKGGGGEARAEIAWGANGNKVESRGREC